MLRGKIQGSKVILICDCGNSNQSMILPFIRSGLTVDSKGRNKLIKTRAHRCNVCQVITDHNEVMQTIREALEVDRQNTPETVN